MESIDILTGQHVTIRYEAAGLLRRGAALILDYIFIFLYAYTFIYIFLEYSGLSDSIRHLPGGIRYILLAIIFIPIVFYHFIFESLMGGRTPGKIISGIRVTNLDGSTPGLLSYFLRWILLPIDLFPTGIGVGGLFIAFSKNHQRIGDLAAGTIVVRNIKPPKLDLDKDFMEYSDDYQPTFDQVELLSDGQIRFITNMLYDPLNKRAVTSSIEALSAKVKDLLKVESDLDGRTFLETVVRDYNYYAWQGI
ncbi:MAG: RDD family protein [Bacteroidales bacterium]|nr:RDD family protein [Bacteroidales bacterium]